MNKDVFLRHVENSRDCDQRRLERAVREGLRRARGDRFDAKKLFMLAAASALAAALCVTAQAQPLQAAVERYYRSRQEMMPGSSELLNGCISALAVHLKNDRGGE